MAEHDDWMDWQREHADALLALQEAQRTYHRVLAGGAFAGTVTAEATDEALHALDAARMRLDEVRGRQPR